MLFRSQTQPSTKTRSMLASSPSLSQWLSSPPPSPTCQAVLQAHLSSSLLLISPPFSCFQQWMRTWPCSSHLVETTYTQAQPLKTAHPRCYTGRPSTVSTYRHNLATFQSISSRRSRMGSLLLLSLLEYLRNLGIVRMSPAFKGGHLSSQQT